MQDGKSNKMHLAILRHGDANWPLPGQSDFNRELSVAGEAEAHRVGLYLNKINFKPDIVICSSAARCIKTLSALKTRQPFEAKIDVSDELYHSDIEKYLTALTRHKNASNVLLIGHNPTLEDLLIHLLGSEVTQSAVPFGLQTAGLVIIELDLSHDGMARDVILVDSFAPYDQTI